MAIEKVDLVIVGAGPSGLAAAAEVAQRGGNVVVLDEAPMPGGRLPSQVHLEPRQTGVGQRRWSNGVAKAERLTNDAKAAGVKILCGASVWGIFANWYVAVATTDASRLNNGYPTGFEARAVLIATGATQNPLILSGWTLPGVITAGAAQTMINVHRILPGRRAVIIGIDPLSLSVAQLMVAVGADVLGVFLPPANGLQFGPSSPKAAIEQLSRFSEYAPSKVLAVAAKLSKYISGLVAKWFPHDGLNVEGFSLKLRQTVLAVDGFNRAERVKIATVNSNAELQTGSEKELEIDVAIASGGLSPLVELAQVAGCRLTYIPPLGGWVPLHNDRFETSITGLFVAGSNTGVEGAAVAEAQGRVAGVSAAAYLELAGASDVERDLRVQQAAVSRARKEAIPFYPDIETGRGKMGSLWLERSRFRSRELEACRHERYSF